MRYFDSEFAINDFLTNAYSEFNPRHIFIYLIIYGSKLFHIHWYHFFFFLKIIVVILLPLVHFFTIYIFITKKSQTILSYYVFTFLNLPIKLPFIPESNRCSLYFQLKSFIQSFDVLFVS